MNDNVKKVFNLLGIEPNEKFKLAGKDNAIYCLTENLTGSLFDERGEKYEFIVEWLLPSMLINPERIIKLPKEPIKKKKLRDLTKEEYDKWLYKNCGDCSECIFRKVMCADSCYKDSWINNKDLYCDEFLNQEIEVEE